MNEPEYRIIENVGGTFTVQTLTFDLVITGYLWWKKSERRPVWINLNHTFPTKEQAINFCSHQKELWKEFIKVSQIPPIYV